MTRRKSTHRRAPSRRRARRNPPTIEVSLAHPELVFMAGPPNSKGRTIQQFMRPIAAAVPNVLILNTAGYRPPEWTVRFTYDTAKGAKAITKTGTASIEFNIGKVTQKTAKDIAKWFSRYPAAAWYIADGSEWYRESSDKFRVFLEALKKTPLPKPEEMHGAPTPEQRAAFQAIEDRIAAREAEERKRQRDLAKAAEERRKAGIGTSRPAAFTQRKLDQIRSLAEAAVKTGAITQAQVQQLSPLELPPFQIQKCTATRLLPRAIVLPVPELLLASARSMFEGTPTFPPAPKGSDKSEYRRTKKAESIARRERDARQRYLPAKPPALYELPSSLLSSTLTRSETVTSSSVNDAYFDSFLLRVDVGSQDYRQRVADFIKLIHTTAYGVHYSAVKTAGALADVYLVPVGDVVNPTLPWKSQRGRAFPRAMAKWLWKTSATSPKAAARVIEVQISQRNYGFVQYGAVMMPPIDTDGERGVDPFLKSLRQAMLVYLRGHQDAYNARIAQVQSIGRKDAVSIVRNCTLKTIVSDKRLTGAIYPDPIYTSDLYLPGLYTDRIINRVLAEYVCYRANLPELVDDSIGMERSKFNQALKTVKAANHINSIADLRAFLKDPDRSKLPDEQAEVLLQMVDDAVGIITYENIEAAEGDFQYRKVFKRSLYEFAPKRPPACVRTSIQFDDAPVARALVFAVAPLMRRPSDLQLCVTAKHYDEPVAFKEVMTTGVEPILAAARQQTALTAANLKTAIIDKKTLKSIGDAIDEDAFAPMCFVFITVKGPKASWPKFLQIPAEVSKGFYLSEEGHMSKLDNERTFALVVNQSGEGVSSTAKVIKVPYRDANRVFHGVMAATKRKAVSMGEGITCNLLLRDPAYHGAETGGGGPNDALYFKNLIQQERVVRLQADEQDYNALVDQLDAGEVPADKQAEVMKKAGALAKKITRARDQFNDLRAMNVQFPFYFMWAVRLFMPPGPVRSGDRTTIERAAQASAITRARSAGGGTGVSERTIMVQRRAFQPGSLSKLARAFKDLAKAESFPYDRIGTSVVQRELSEFVDRDLQDVISDSALVPTDYRLPEQQFPAAFVDEETEDIMATLNPRGSRMRKPRKPRRRRMRRNPSDDYRSALREHLDSTKQLPEDWPSVDDEVDFSDINMIFPRAVREYPMLEVQKVAERLGDRPYVRSVRRQPSRFSEFDEEGLVQLGQQQGLSLVEMQGLARRYKDAGDRRKKTTIPASSALCGANRRPKLRDYKLPRALATYPAGSYHKKVLIWISPEGSYPIRIMTFRRNTHIDCDMLVDAEKGRSYGGVLALAIQDTLLWLSQKPKSRGNAECFVGRIGSPDIYRFWGPGQDFKYTSALNTMQVSKIPVTKYDEAARQADIEAYFRAAGGRGPTPPSFPPPAGPTGGDDGGDDSGGGSGGAPPSSGSGRSPRRSRRASAPAAAPAAAPAPEPAPAPQPAPSRKRRSRDVNQKAKAAAKQAVAQTPPSAPKATSETPEPDELADLIATQEEELPSVGQTAGETVVEEGLIMPTYYGDDEPLDNDPGSVTFGQEPGSDMFKDATTETPTEYATDDKDIPF